MFDKLIAHSSEIALKGGNQQYFVSKLKGNIGASLRGLGVKKIGGRHGRVILGLAPEAQLEKIGKQLACIPGIANFSFAISVPAKIEEIIKEAAALAVSIAQKGRKGSFRVSTQRGTKEFPLTSQQVNERVGAEIVRQTGMKVNLSAPELTVFIEIADKEAYLYTEKIAGMGGLPTSTSGKVVALLSGGIDSPVAAYLMMKRGGKVVFVHFQSEGMVKAQAKEKVVALVEKLAKFQLGAKLYLVPFGKIQQEIIKQVPAKVRMIVYRRVMFRIAEEIREKEKAGALVTGDSLGQVASQTLENLQVIYEAAQCPVFAPLMGTNKEETVDIARKIGTYEISILPYEDCCSFFVAKHPETRGSLAEIKRSEERLAGSLGALVLEALEKSKAEEFRVG